jgi:hypothetical protein
MAATGFSVFGCSGNERYEMGQTIEMGPFTFRVESASAATSSHDGKPRREIAVELWQLNVEPGENIDLARFLIPGSEFAPRPQIKIRDREGHEYLGSVGLKRGDRWPVSFELVAGSRFTAASRERADRFAEQQLSKGPRDFRLYITNPDRRAGQPREVWLQLRDYRPTR